METASISVGREARNGQFQASLEATVITGWDAFREKQAQQVVLPMGRGVSSMGRVGMVGMLWWSWAVLFRSGDVVCGHRCDVVLMCHMDGGSCFIINLFCNTRTT